MGTANSLAVHRAASSTMTRSNVVLVSPSAVRPNPTHVPATTCLVPAKNVSKLRCQVDTLPTMSRPNWTTWRSLSTFAACRLPAAPSRAARVTPSTSSISTPSNGIAASRDDISCSIVSKSESARGPIAWDSPANSCSLIMTGITLSSNQSTESASVESKPMALAAIRIRSRKVAAKRSL
ncbi:hypothetical protein D3C71_1130880 [compost metagenome]